MGYNGYTNYETWLTSLYYEETIREYMKDNKEKTMYKLSEGVKEFFDEIFEEELSSLPYFLLDLIQISMCNINWYELIETYSEELEEEEEEKEEDE